MMCRCFYRTVSSMQRAQYESRPFIACLQTYESMALVVLIVPAMVLRRKRCKGVCFIKRIPIQYGAVEGPPFIKERLEAPTK